MKETDEAEVIKELTRRRGDMPLREYASTIGCSHAYLYDVLNGSRKPGPKILKSLGIEKRVITKTIYRWR